jgi:hypothetical protein
VALLAVERRVAEHPVVSNGQGRLGHDGAELRRVVGGPRLARAAVKKWLAASQVTVSFVHSRQLCLRLARRKK